MNSPATVKAKQAFTLIELLVVVSIVGILMAMLLPAITDRGCTPAKSTICMSNLKQISIGVLLYHQDNKDQSPWPVSVTADNGAADCFLRLTSYLPHPKILTCPSDPARQVAATNYAGFSNTNLSYFASLDVSLTTATTNAFNLIFSGDRHLAWNTQPLEAGLFSATNNAAMSWTKELHWVKNQTETLGVMAFADGHCEAVKTKKLPATFRLQNLVANRLVIP